MFHSVSNLTCCILLLVHSIIRSPDSDQNLTGDVEVDELSSGIDPLQATSQDVGASTSKMRGLQSLMGYDGTNDSPYGSTRSKTNNKKAKTTQTRMGTPASSPKTSPASAARLTSSRARRRVVESDGDESDDDVFSSAVPRGTQPFTGSAQRKTRSSRQTSSAYEFSDSDDSPTIPSPRRSSVKKPRSKAARKSGSKDLTSSASDEPRSKVVTQFDDDSDSEPIQQSPFKRRRSTAQIMSDDSDASPMKRQRVVVPTVEEEEEEASDNPVSARAPVRSAKCEASSPITPSRLTRQQRKSPRKHRTDKEKARELFMRRRNGEKIEAVTDSESDSEDERAVYDSDPELQALNHFEDEEPDEEIAAPKRKQTKSIKSRARARSSAGERMIECTRRRMQQVRLETEWNIVKKEEDATHHLHNTKHRATIDIHEFPQEKTYHSRYSSNFPTRFPHLRSPFPTPRVRLQQQSSSSHPHT